MTTYEHAMLGVSGALAAGLHRRYGWQIVAMAGLTAVLPDWDGLALLFGPAAFDRCHRVWGHNVFVASITGALAAAVLYRFRLLDAVARRFSKSGAPDEGTASGNQLEQHDPKALAIWVLTGIAASLSHLAADLVVSGHRDLDDWELQLLWPFSTRGWVYPMMPWGDIGATLVFVAGMFAMARFRRHVQPIAIATLLGVAAYIAIRGSIGR